MKRISCPAEEACAVDAESIASGQSRLIEYLIPQKARELYRELKRSARAQRLGDLADVGIGYVTGANDFFHLDPDEVARRRFRITASSRRSDEAGRLTVSALPSTIGRRPLPGERPASSCTCRRASGFLRAVREYLDHGESLGIEKAYKCRSRSPWFCVPHVYQPDAFLTYMSGSSPRLVANDAQVYAPNSLHILRIHPLTRIPGDVVASLWQTSLTRLSVEIEGHALGGGMLKLEPTEAGNVLLPAPDGRRIGGC